MSVEIREYEPGDFERLKQSFDSIFNVDRGLDEFHWKFLIWNRAARPLIAVAVDGREIVGSYAAVQSKIYCKGQPIEIYQSVDNFVAKRYRNGAVYRDVFRHFWDIYPPPESMLFGFPGARSFGFGRNRLGYRAIDRMARYQLQLSSRSRGPYHPAKADRVNGIIVQPLITPTDELARLDREIASLYEIVGERGIEHINRRYLSHPRQGFRLFEARSLNGEILGYAVGTVVRGGDGSKIGRVYDLVVPHSDASAVLLLDQLLSALAGDGAEHVFFYCTPVYKDIPVFEAAGFVRSDVEDFCLAMVGDEAAEVRFGVGGRWCCTLGDTDL